MDKLDTLYRHAARLRLDVAWSDLPSHIHGYYEDSSRLVVLNRRCTHAQALSALAHEIGHGAYGDQCSTDRVERRADEVGASLIITRDEYAAAERLCGPHAGALARQLGVTRELVLAWRRWHLRASAPAHRLVERE